MGRQSRLKQERKAETAANAGGGGISRRRFLGISTLGIVGIVGGDSPILQSRESLEEMIAPYGVVIYEQNPSAENTLYIIGQIHKLNDREVSSKVGYSQLQIYRIIESIGLHQGNFPLLISEGRLVEKDYFEDATNQRQHFVADRFEFLRQSNDQTIIDYVVNTGSKSQVDAALLISAAYGSDHQGWEDRDISLRQSQAIQARDQAMDRDLVNVQNLLDRLDKGEAIDYNSQKSNEEINELKALADYFIDYRSLIMLQNSPKVLEREFGKKRLEELEGIAIIGNGHLDKVVKYIREGKSDIAAINPKYFTEFGALPTINQPVDLSKYHVIVIKPHEF